MLIDIVTVIWLVFFYNVLLTCQSCLAIILASVADKVWFVNYEQARSYKYTRKSFLFKLQTVTNESTLCMEHHSLVCQEYFKNSTLKFANIYHMWKTNFQVNFQMIEPIKTIC